MTRETLEGYPGTRFHGGGRYADVVEQAAIDRAKDLFGCEYANVQPHSRSQANLAVFFALLKPGDTVLRIDFAAGGCCSHGLGANLSGSWFDAHHYGVDRETGLTDYDRLEEQALELRPALLIAGGSAYPRELDFEPFRHDRTQGWSAIPGRDMAHIAGLVAGGVHTSPLPHVDVLTCTGPRPCAGRAAG